MFQRKKSEGSAEQGAAASSQEAGVEIDLRILELAVSKLCHDIISPVSAIGNGMEVLEEMGPDAGDDALDLIGHSAAQASSKVLLFRLIYGRAGTEDGRPTAEFRNALFDYLGEGRITLTWPEDTLAEFDDGLPQGTVKTVSNFILLAVESLHGSGEVTLSKDGDQVRISALGSNSRLHEGTEEALAGDVDPDTLEPRLVHAYLAGRFAAAFGLKVSHAAQQNEGITFTLTLPVSS